MIGAEKSRLAWLLFVVLAAAALLAVSSRASPSRRALHLALLLGLGAGAAAVDAVVREPPAPPANRPIEVASDGYVSSRTCRACHPREYATWYGSYHRKMTQLPAPETVRADFDGVELEHDGLRHRLERRGDEFWIATRTADGGPAPVAARRKVVLVTGSHHAQLFWLPGSDSRKLDLFGLAWRIAERRWLPLDTIFLTPPGTHQPLDGARWNTNCSQCHATHARPRMDGADGSFDTDVGDFGISCEACHGPGEQHVRLNRDPVRRYSIRARGESDPSIVQPEQLTTRRASDVCGQCHAIHMFVDDEVKLEWNVKGLKYRPGDQLAEVGQRFLLRFGETLERPVLRSYFEQNPDFLDQFFWSDGVIRLAGREYNGLVESPCYQRGEMSCMSCHQLHQQAADTRPVEQWADDQLKPEGAGNLACTGCHAQFVGDAALAAHTYHAPGSSGSECMNCHMSYTTYGLLKAQRSHTIENPSVATSLATGRPNACNQCHLDRTLGWAAERLSAWYGIAPPVLGEDEASIAASVLWIVRGNSGQRALMAWSMGWAPALAASGDHGWMPFYLAQLLGDEYSAVRVIAARSLRRRPEFADLDYDPTGSPESLRAASERVLLAWGRLPPSARGASEAVLVGADGQVRMDVAMRLLERRDMRRLHLSE